MTVYLHGNGQLGIQQQNVIADLHLRQQCDAVLDLMAQLMLLLMIALHKCLGVLLVLTLEPHNLHTLHRIGDALDLHTEAKAVQQLGTQFTFVRVHSANQNEFGRMGEGNTLPFHGIGTHGSRVQQKVHNVIVQQIDLIHIENATVGHSQHTGLELLLAALDGSFYVQRTYHTILSCRNRQIHNGHPNGFHLKGFAAHESLIALVAHFLRIIGITMERAALDHIDFRQQPGQRTNGGGFCGTLFAEDQYTAHLGVHCIEDQCLLHGILTYNGGKGEILLIHIFLSKVTHISVPFLWR